MTKKPTITTVAQHAGVGVSTVSRYLNGRPVSRPVQARLSEIIARLGYARSWTARNLSLGRRGCIGVVIDVSSDPSFVQLLTGIEEELSTRDTGLMLCSVELRRRYDAALVFDWIHNRRVDGLILAKTQRRDRSLLLAAISAQLPIVTVMPNETLPEVPSVRCNNIEAGAVVARHLADMGHRHIAFAGGPANSIDSRHRLQGLREALASRGIRIDPCRVYSCGGWEADAGSRFAEGFLVHSLDVSALVLANDALAFGFMRVALQHGVRMPAELSIIGFDGLPQGELFYPALTTVAQPMREMGRVACRRLFEAIEGPGRVEKTEFTMELISRESTGRAPVVRGRAGLHLLPSSGSS